MTTTGSAKKLLKALIVYPKQQAATIKVPTNFGLSGVANFEWRVGNLSLER